MDALTGRPKLLKQANLALIRKAIKAKETATRAGLAEETGISSTTIRSLLTEMLENGEIESVGHDASSGGRKAERYRFRPERYHSAVFCMTDEELHFLLVNVCGEIVEQHPLEIVERDFEGAIVSCLDALVQQWELRSIGLGVPGIVEGGSYWKKECLGDEELHRSDIGDRLSRRYGLPVVMENDLKAVTIGFGRCYEAKYPHEDSEDVNMAYLHFDKGSVSGGFLAGGRIIRGSGNAAGELSLIPMGDSKTLDDCISESMDDLRYVELVSKILTWICAILNPRYIALGGPGLRRDCIGPIGDALSALLPRSMCAEILCAPDVWYDYHSGMAYLTAAKMFDEVQLVKE